MQLELRLSSLCFCCIGLAPAGSGHVQQGLLWLPCRPVTDTWRLCLFDMWQESIRHTLVETHDAQCMQL